MNGYIRMLTKFLPRNQLTVVGVTGGFAVISLMTTIRFMYMRYNKQQPPTEKLVNSDPMIKEDANNSSVAEDEDDMMRTECSDSDDNQTPCDEQVVSEDEAVNPFDITSDCDNQLVDLEGDKHRLTAELAKKAVTIKKEANMIHEIVIRMDETASRSRITSQPVKKTYKPQKPLDNRPPWRY